MTDPTDHTTDIHPITQELADLIAEKLDQNVSLCYQCTKCSNGCPLADYFDLYPNQIMRALQLGQEEMVFKSHTPWLCASCQTCTTRCPQNLDVAGIMEFLTREGITRGYPIPEPKVDIFNKAFMNEVKLWGRAYELGMIAEMKVKTKEWTDDLDLGFRMLSKGKLKLLPRPVKKIRSITPHPDANSAVAYYPGCSLHASALEYNESTKAVCEALDIQLVEPEDWVCCGSSAGHRSQPQLSLNLQVRNLSIVEQSGFSEVMMPCAACYNRHKTAQFELKKQPEQQTQLSENTGYEYKGQVQVTSFAEAILKHIPLEKIQSLTKFSLDGIKLVCYYGCLLTRPPEVTGITDCENPNQLELILSSMGAEVLDWSYKTSCCGAAHSITNKKIAIQLSRNLILHAQETEAQAIVVACPLCHTNLDSRQFQMDLQIPLPILYISQLMAYAFGLSDDKSCLDKNFINPRSILKGSVSKTL